MKWDDLSQLGVLRKILKETEFAVGQDGDLYNIFSWDDRQVTYPAFSPDFMAWFRGVAMEELCAVPSARLLKLALNEAEHEARQSEQPPRPVALRFHAEESSLVIHLGNGACLDIDAIQAEPQQYCGVIFPTRINTENLPAPQSADVRDVLPEFLDLPEEGYLLVLAWLMSLFQPEGKFPFLIIIGAGQSGKTWLACITRRLIDPHPLPVLPLPKDINELKAAARVNAILVFDNVEKIPPVVTKGLLALAEGAALVLPGSSGTVPCKRPVILVADDLPDCPELVEKAIVVRLKERPANQIKSKGELDRMFERDHAKALGSVLHLYSLALQHLNKVKLGAVHKDAALEKWHLAVDGALGLEGKLMTILKNNRDQALDSIISERPAPRAFQSLVKAKGSVKATATQLLEDIEPFLDGPKDARYPTNGKAFAKLLRDHERFMADIEIEFDVRTGKGRDRNIVATWQSAKTATVSAPVTPPSTEAAPKRKKVRHSTFDQPALI